MQTEDIDVSTKWTQHPVKYSSSNTTDNLLFTFAQVIMAKYAVFIRVIDTCLNEEDPHSFIKKGEPNPTHVSRQGLLRFSECVGFKVGGGALI